MSVRITGLNSLSQSFENLKDASADSIAKALTHEAHQLLKIADPITPEDKGPLRKSGRVIAPPKTAKKRIIARIRWGGSKAPYAAWVHEMPASYNYTKPGTGPKYAEKAATSLASTFTQSVADFLGIGLKKRFPATNTRAKATVVADLGK